MGPLHSQNRLSSCVSSNSSRARQHLKTAITTPFGLFESLRMPFGLRNAAQTFQRFINEVLRGLHFCYAYIDDLLIASSSPEEHKHHVREVLERLQEHGILINPRRMHDGYGSRSVCE